MINLCDNAALAQSGQWQFRQLSWALFMLAPGSPYCQALRFHFILASTNYFNQRTLDYTSDIIQLIAFMQLIKKPSVSVHPTFFILYPII